MKISTLLLSSAIFLGTFNTAHAMTCRDVTFSVRNTTGAVVRITKVRYRDFENHRTRTTDFGNRVLGRRGDFGQVIGLSINLKNVRNEQVGEFEFQYQNQTSPAGLLGISSWGDRRWTTRQGNINNCQNNQGAGSQILIPG